MFGWLTGSHDARLQKLVQDAVEGAAQEVLKRAGKRLAGFEEAVGLQDEVLSLKREVEDLKIQKATKKEEFDRREREIEHKLGLHKKQVEWETDEAGRRAKLDVEEGHLSDRQDLFEERMGFMTSRFEEEVKYQRDMLEKMLKKLPSAEIIAQIGGKRKDG